MHTCANACVLSASEHLRAIVHVHICSSDKAFCVVNVNPYVPILYAVPCLCIHTNACVRVTMHGMCTS